MHPTSPIIPPDLQIRNGRITRSDQHRGRGTLIDENDQEIFFFLEEPQGQVKIGDTVCFQIEFTQQGLTAFILAINPA